MSELFLAIIGKSPVAELEPKGTKRTIVENLVIKLDTIIENTVVVDLLDEQ